MTFTIPEGRRFHKVEQITVTFSRHSRSHKVEQFTRTPTLISSRPMDPWWETGGDPWCAGSKDVQSKMSVSASHIKGAQMCDIGIQVDAQDKVCVAKELLATVVKSGGSRQVVAATASALWRLCKDDGEGGSSEQKINEYEIGMNAARSVLGEQVGMSDVCRQLKAGGNATLAKQLAGAHKSRNVVAHAASHLASRITRVLSGNPNNSSDSDNFDGREVLVSESDSNTTEWHHLQYNISEKLCWNDEYIGVEPCSSQCTVLDGGNCAEQPVVSESDLSALAQLPEFSEEVISQEQFESLSCMLEPFGVVAPFINNIDGVVANFLADVTKMGLWDRELASLAEPIASSGLGNYKYEKYSLQLQETIDEHNKNITDMIEVASGMFGVLGVSKLIMGLRTVTYTRVSPLTVGRVVAKALSADFIAPIKKKRVRTKNGRK